MVAIWCSVAFVAALSAGVAGLIASSSDSPPENLATRSAIPEVRVLAETVQRLEASERRLIERLAAVERQISDSTASVSAPPPASAPAAPSGPSIQAALLADDPPAPAPDHKPAGELVASLDKTPSVVGQLREAFQQREIQAREAAQREAPPAPPRAAAPPPAASPPAPAATPARPTSSAAAELAAALQSISPEAARAAPTPAASAFQAPGRDLPVTRTQFGIDLGAEGGLNALRNRWTNLSARHRALLDGLEPRVGMRESASGSAELRLLAGPIPNAETASRICVTLSSQGVPCQAAAFEGQRLLAR